MCASYGLGGFGPRDLADRYDLEPLDEGRVDEAGAGPWLNGWLESGQARITGRRARNLNPLVREEGGDRLLEPAWWWLWPNASGPAGFSAFNSRDDALLRRWRPYFRAHRALVPATWFVEKKTRIGLGGELFSVAAVCHVVETADGPLTTYSLVTRDAPAHLAGVNPRMPLVLARDSEAEWLAADRPGDEALLTDTLAASEDPARRLAVEGGPAGAAPAGEPRLF